MSVAFGIAKLRDQMLRYDINDPHICYELDETEWREFIDFVQKFFNANSDLSYMEKFTYMGIKVRKLPADQPT